MTTIAHCPRMRRHSSTDVIECEFKSFLEQINLSDEQLTCIMNKLLEEMKKGLGKDTNPDAKVKMIPSYVTNLPDGTEKGSYLALDLGGTNFRVLLVTIKDDTTGNGKPSIEMDSQIYKMPSDVITGNGEKLFDHIALCMADFLTQLEIMDQKLPVGFTFSFPCKQSGLDHAELITWTKGFNAEGVVGEDIVKMLRRAIKKRGDIDVDIIAIVNDTVGTMMSCAFSEISCEIGLIVGTGSNACYMEKLSNIELIDANDGEMCINMEWGAFGDDGALEDYRTDYDIQIDDSSINRGKQIYEKMISGMYMGELVRLMLVKLCNERLILGGILPDALSIPGKFESHYVSQIESNSGPYNMSAVQNILVALDIGAMKLDCDIISQVCAVVSRRAAHLCAAGIAAIALKIKGNHPENDNLVLTVGVDGTVYKKHPTFSKLMQEKVNTLVQGSGVTVKFALSYDGSGKGAALITAVAHRLNRRCSSSVQQAKH